MVRPIKSYSSQLCKRNIAKQVMNLVKNGTKYWSPKLWHGDLIHFSELGTIEISIKSGKHGITTLSWSYIIHKVRLGKNLRRSILAFKGPRGDSENHQLWWFLSLTLSFFFPELRHCRYIDFTALTCTATIILLEPCALNAEIQQFVLRFYKISILYG